MKPYEWMVEYTPQTLWIEKKGLFVWLAEVTGVLGGGLYLVSLYFNVTAGMLGGWLLVVSLKTACHMAHLGRPVRFWRLALKPGSSWLARGFLFLLLFSGFGAGQFFFTYLLPHPTWEWWLKALTAVMAVPVAGYAGYLLNYVRGIPFWASGLLPVLLFFSGLTGGLALLLLIGMFAPGIDSRAILEGFSWLLGAQALLVVTFLWSAAYGSRAGERSVKELTEGPTAPVLWLGVFGLGLIVPLATVFYELYAGAMPAAFLSGAAVCVVLGVLSLNYCLLKGAFYSPLLPRFP